MVFTFLHGNCSELISFSTVSNKIFGLVMTGYKEGLNAIIKRSVNRAKNNDVSPSIVYGINLLINLQFVPIGSEESEVDVNVPVSPTE
jgi:hypothetical protein